MLKVLSARTEVSPELRDRCDCNGLELSLRDVRLSWEQCRRWAHIETRFCKGVQ